MKHLNNLLDNSKNLPSKVKKAGLAALVTTIIAVGSDTALANQEPIPDNYLIASYQQEKREKIYMGIGLFGLFVGGTVILEYFRRICPKCDKTWGLEHQGTKNTVKGWARLVIKNDVDTYKCKRCGYVVKKPSNRE